MVHRGHPRLQQLKSNPRSRGLHSQVRRRGIVGGCGFVDACIEAIDDALVLAIWRTLSRVFTEWDGLLGSGARSYAALATDLHTDLCVRCIVSVIIARSQEE